jgi:hypothetical protein
MMIIFRLPRRQNRPKTIKASSPPWQDFARLVAMHCYHRFVGVCLKKTMCKWVPMLYLDRFGDVWNLRGFLLLRFVAPLERRPGAQPVGGSGFLGAGGVGVKGGRGERKEKDFHAIHSDVKSV